ncbi:hypothetical protein BG006_003030 [Podila minutissima]|uniref:BTB domain-containing protein n=1 Tax=Podila minutissima TaxID=64525 RepID=A0A9P5SQ33_9FUNG|nr:hypothetical protein BG006_003030 [Podila minutissima]
MFSKDLTEGGSGKTEFRIRDINRSTFLQMLNFLYMGEFDGSPPAILESNNPDMAKESTWEGLYLAVHRYRIDDLRKQALDKILGHLDKSDAVALLFWLAYLFEELRGPVIKHIAQVCHVEIAKKETHNIYKDHLEGSELLVELFDAHRNLCGNCCA